MRLVEFKGAINSVFINPDRVTGVSHSSNPAFTTMVEVWVDHDDPFLVPGPIADVVAKLQGGGR